MNPNLLMSEQLLDARTLKSGVEADAALYFMPQGHFLFRYQESGRWCSKFVTIDDVAKSLANIESDSGWLGAGILRTGRSQRGNWFVYTAPAQKMSLLLTDETDRVEEPVHNVPIPATVLIGVGHAYFLYAVADDVVTPASKLYHAPFPNVYGHHRICWGNNAHPVASVAAAPQVWRLFFATPFNAHLANEKSKAYQKNVNEQLRQVAGRKKYPVADLVPIKDDLAGAVRTVLERGWND